MHPPAAVAYPPVNDVPKTKDKLAGHVMTTSGTGVVVGAIVVVAAVVVVVSGAVVVVVPFVGATVGVDENVFGNTRLFLTVGGCVRKTTTTEMITPENNRNPIAHRNP